MEKIDVKSEYLKAYYNNEYDANRQMTFALLFAAILMFIIWMGYLFRLFIVTDVGYIIINITFPIMIGFLITPMFYLKTEKYKKPRYKYFLLFNLVFVMGVFNTIIPKHAIIGWGICIVIVNHYYNPKLGKIIFGVTAVSMLVCMYAAMFLGEFDPDLLTGEVEDAVGIIHSAFLPSTYPDTPVGRYEYLKALKEIGMNRYLTTFIFYYLGRIICLTVLFFVSNSLNKRTYKLLVDEIRVNSDHEKFNTELEVAQRLQIQTLPKSIISSRKVEIQAELKAARVVGGDFYDYFRLDKDNIAFVIGDVSGKGVGAAMFMMKTITCLNDFASIKRSPAETLKLVNKQLYKGNDSSVFVTCFYAIINTLTGQVRFSNAGHLPPVVGSNRNFHFLKCRNGFVLGGLEDAFVCDEEFYLKPGEQVTLYTDGITEAQNLIKELFGDKRMIDTYNKRDYASLLDLHKELKNDLNEFTKGAEQSDDITYITLKYNGTNCDFVEIKASASQDEATSILDQIGEFAKKNELSTKVVANIKVISDELISNIIKFAYDDGEDGTILIRLLCNHDTKELTITIMDEGKEFNPFEGEREKISGNIDDIQEGGLGILIVKKLCNSYAYDRINNKNVVYLNMKI